MPNSILPQDQDGQDLFNAISSFFCTFGIGNLLRKCNAQKEKGVPILDIFKYKLCNVFSDRSMYMQQKTGSFKESFSKNTFYRFLNSPKTNWLRFTTLLSKKVVDKVEPLTDDERVNAFIVDDSLFERTSCKKTELGSRVFDHTSMKYRKGYRLMTLGWTDGNTFLPINSCLLASSKEHNLIGPVEQFDGRSLAAKRRKFAQMKGTEVMIELLRNAHSAGHSADYVLFDTWFSSPAQLIAVKNLGLDSIAMIKKSSRIYYEYEGEQLSIKKIFGICKKRRGRSKYLLSVNVMVGKEKLPAKIVCVRNKKNKKDWIAFICTVAIVFTRYLMIAMEQRRNEDDRTLGEIFYFFTDELKDITFGESFHIIITAMIESVCAIFQPTEEQLELFIEMFVGRLPEYIRNSLAKAALAA